MIQTTRTACLGAAVACLLAACKTQQGSDRDLFSEADKNHDKKLTLAEVNETALPRTYSYFDRDGNGSVTFAEMRQLEPSFSEKAFQDRDLNKDGKVTYKEYEAFAVEWNVLRGQFEHVDTSKDGAIDQAEAAVWLDKRKKNQP